jgi:hypothetical protein
MKNILKGVQAVGNSRPNREMYIPYAVVDTRTGVEIFQGTSKECSDYAMDVESGRIPSYLAIICIG